MTTTPIFRLFFITVLYLTVCACTRQPMALPELSPDAIILAFGDSLTYGSGASPLNNYPGILSRLTKRQVVNQGVPGEISEDGLKRLPELLDEYQPRLLILIHGGNDILRKIPDEVIAGNLDKMIKEAKNRQIAVLMLGVPKPGLFFMKSADLYETAAQRNQVPIDLDTLPKILGDNKLKSDPIHPNDAGYRTIAENIFNLLKEAGAL